MQVPLTQFRVAGRRSTLFLVAACFLTLALAQDAQVDTSRRVVTRVVPVYPALARRINLQGVVRLRVTVSREGNPKTADVVGGNPIFVKPAQDAIMKWQWAPASHDTSEVIELTFQPH